MSEQSPARRVVERSLPWLLVMLILLWCASWVCHVSYTGNSVEIKCFRGYIGVYFDDLPRFTFGWYFDFRPENREGFGPLIPWRPVWFIRPGIRWLLFPIWLFLIPIVIPLTINRRREQKHPAKTLYCEECGYNLTGNTSGRCPECGEAVERQA